MESALGIESAALLLLLLPFWSFAIEHQVLAEYWVLAEILLATGAILCGIFWSVEVTQARCRYCGPYNVLVRFGPYFC